MSVLDRLILIAVALLLLVLGLLGLVDALGWDATPLLDHLHLFLQSRRLEVGLISLLLVLAALHIFFFAGVQERDTGIVRETPLGQIRTHSRAIENLVVRSARNVHGVRDVDAVVRPKDESVEIRVSLVAESGVNIPDVTEQVQRRIEEEVRATTGVSVAGIVVEVRNVAGQSKQRVE